MAFLAACVIICCTPARWGREGRGRRKERGGKGERERKRGVRERRDEKGREGRWREGFD